MPYELKKPTINSENLRRTPAQRDIDLVYIANRYLQGWPAMEIAAELAKMRPYNITPRQISYDIETLHKRWRKSQLVDYDAAKAKELAHLDELEKEYWIAWQNSLKKEEIVQSETIQDGSSFRGTDGPVKKRNRARKTERSSYGEAAYLQGVQWCIEQRCKILGLSSTTQNINVSWRKQAEQAGVDPDGVVDELVKQFVAAARVDGSGGSGSMG